MDLAINDNPGGATEVSMGALTVADQWQFVKVDISGVANASKDAVVSYDILLSVAGASALTGGVEAIPSAAWGAATRKAERTNWYLDPSAGTGFLIAVTDESANQLMVAYSAQ